MFDGRQTQQKSDAMKSNSINEYVSIITNKRKWRQHARAIAALVTLEAKSLADVALKITALDANSGNCIRHSHEKLLDCILNDIQRLARTN
jgi:uncharacterized protein YjiS (DUF1127 family)